jgi:beta-glucosidase
MQGGTLGMALDSEWGEPLTSSEADKEAAERHVLFQMGW